MIKLDPNEKKMLKIAGVLALIAGGVGLAVHLSRRGQDDDTEDIPYQEVKPDALPAPAPKPKEDLSKDWAPDATLSYGSKRKRMVSQLQHVLNAIARLKGDAQLKVDGVWGSNTQARVKKYFGKDSTTYNRARMYAMTLYKSKGLSYPDGKPLAGGSGSSSVLPTVQGWTIPDPGSQWDPNSQWVTNPTVPKNPSSASGYDPRFPFN